MLSKYWIFLYLTLLIQTKVINGIKCFTCSSKDNCDVDLQVNECAEQDIGCMVEGYASMDTGNPIIEYSMVCASESYCPATVRLCGGYDVSSKTQSCRGCCHGDKCNSESFLLEYVRDLTMMVQEANAETKRIDPTESEPYTNSNSIDDGTTIDREPPLDESQTEEPVTEPQTEEPVTEPQTEEPVTEPETEEPETEEPETVEPETAPKLEEPFTEPQTEEPVTEPQTEEPVTEPQTEEPVTEPQTEEPVTEPQTEEPVTEPKTTLAPSTRPPLAEMPTYDYNIKSVVNNEESIADPTITQAQTSSQTQYDNFSYKILPNSLLFILISFATIFL